MSSNQPLPGLLSVPRITTLLASLLVSLSSGTNYVYSAYAPQLGARLNITHTQLNIVALAGNVGVYSSGPFWGKIVDSRGPRILLVSAFVFLFLGYSGIRHLYDTGLPTSGTTLSTFAFSMLVAFSFMTGAGGNGGLTSAVNSIAKTFPDRARATTTGIVISGFGLSAFLFTTTAHIFFAGNTSLFLLLLALGTSFPMIVGFFLVRPIPLPPFESMHGLGHNIGDSRLNEAGIMNASVVIHGNDSLARLLDHEDLDNDASSAYTASAPSIEHTSGRNSGALELSPARSVAQDTRLHMSGSSRGSQFSSRNTTVSHNGSPNIFGKNLWCSTDFWLLCSILSMLSGTGLMYINNVGSMALALFSQGNSEYDVVEAARWQASQVSAVSLMNFSGRIFIGLLSDFGKNRLGIPRSYALILVAFFFLISQVTAAIINDVHTLWIASSWLGLAHGSVFSLFPTVCIESFGLLHFSENWGYMSLSPMIAGNLFAVAFGRNLDAHAHAGNKPTHLLHSTQCSQGRECYVDTLHLTIGACSLSMILSVWVGWRDRQKIIVAQSQLLTRRGQVVWEDTDE